MNWSIFDVIGPIMIGPSSSHTAGASRIGYIGFLLNKGVVQKAKITMYGSFAKVYQGHGSDWAIVGGLLGMKSDDSRLTRAYQIAKEKGVDYEFIFDTKTNVSHPNTVKIEVFDQDGGVKVQYIAESVGAGSVVIRSINNIVVDDLDCRDDKVLFIGNKYIDIDKIIKYFKDTFRKYKVHKSDEQFIVEADLVDESYKLKNDSKLILLPKF